MTRLLLALFLAVALLAPFNAFAAPVVASHAESSFETDTTITIAKPSGLTVGDLMLASCAAREDTTLSSPGGSWTLARDEVLEGAGAEAWAYWKIATGGDVAATDFTFTLGANSGQPAICTIYRITGHDTTAPINAVDISCGTNAASSCASDDPIRYGQNTAASTVDDTLALFFGYVLDDRTTNSVSGGGFPSASEDFDLTTTAGNDAAFTGYQGVKATAGSLGGLFTFHDMSGNAFTVGTFLAISPPVVVLQDDTLFEFTE